MTFDGKSGIPTVCELEYEKGTGFILRRGSERRIWNDTCIDLLSIIAENNTKFHIDSGLLASLPEVGERNERQTNSE